MKAILLFVCLLFSGSIQAQKIAAEAVPKPVQDVFIKDFPGVMPSWERSGGRYTASFAQNKYNMQTIYDGTGKRLETHVAIDEKELPEQAREYVKAHNQATISESHKIITAGDKVSFRVSAGGQYMEFDSKGNYLRNANK